MKAFTLILLKPAFRSNQLPIREEESALVPAESSIQTRPTEIRRFLRNLRENRQYNFTRDFVY